MHLVSNKLLKYILDLKIKAAGQGRKAHIQLQDCYANFTFHLTPIL